MSSNCDSRRIVAQGETLRGREDRWGLDATAANVTARFLSH